MPAVVAAGAVGSSCLVPANAVALPRALQELTEECETDACMTNSRRVFNRVSRKFDITQEFGSSQSRSTGSAVWEGDVVLTKYMETELPKGYWKGKKVLELGAGTGFASYVAALLGSKCIITDGKFRDGLLARLFIRLGFLTSDGMPGLYFPADKLVLGAYRGVCQQTLC